MGATGSQARAQQNLREPPEAGCETSPPHVWSGGLGLSASGALGLRRTTGFCLPGPASSSPGPASSSLNPLPPPRDPLPGGDVEAEPWKPRLLGLQTEFWAGHSRCKGRKPWGLQTEFWAGHSRWKGTVGADLARVCHPKESRKARAGEGGLSVGCGEEQGWF